MMTYMYVIYSLGWGSRPQTGVCFINFFLGGRGGNQTTFSPFTVSKKNNKEMMHEEKKQAD